MATLQEVLDKVKSQGEKMDVQATRLAELNMWVENLYEQIKALPLSPENQAKVDEIFAEALAMESRVDANAGRVEEVFIDDPNAPPQP